MFPFWNSEGYAWHVNGQYFDERRKFDGKSIVYKESASIIYGSIACKLIVNLKLSRE